MGPVSSLRSGRDDKEICAIASFDSRRSQPPEPARRSPVEVRKKGARPMANPRASRTNAADTAPGVDDGPASVTPPPVNSNPRGRGAVWIGVLIVVAIFVALFFLRPIHRGENELVGQGQTQADIAASTVPGAADRQEVNRPVTPQGAPTQTPQPGG
jgi:hypothetical protein